MNRQLRRAEERKANKINSWVSNFTPEQEKIINFVVSERVDKKFYSVMMALDTSISAALFELTDLSIKEAENIISKSSDYMKDCEEFLIKYKESWIMEINKNKPDIKKECLKLLDKGIKANNEASRELKKIFIKIPPKDLVNIFQEAKEEYIANEKIIKEVTEEEAKKILPQNQPISEQKSTSGNISQETKKESVEKAREDKKSIFEVVEKKIILKTPNGIYKKTNDGIEYAGKLYKNLDEVKDEKRSILNEIEEKKIKVIKNIEQLQNDLSDLDKTESNLNIRVQEIIAAFAYEG